MGLGKKGLKRERKNDQQRREFSQRLSARPDLQKSRHGSAINSEKPQVTGFYALMVKVPQSRPQNTNTRKPAQANVE